MTQLDKIIKELCPDGVEYYELAQVVSPNRGVRVIKSQLKIEGKHPVFQNCLTPMGYYDSYNFPAGTSFIIVGGAAAEIGYSDVDFWAADDCVGMKCGEKIINSYLYHVLLNKKSYLVSNVRKASIPRLSRTVIEKMQIPVPPLAVQREIVRILDNFTELTARKKQYEYYRDDLLKCNVTIPMVKLKDIATDIYCGTGIKREEVTESGIPCVRYGEIYTTYNTWFDTCKSHTNLKYVPNPKYFEYGDILFAITGESVEDIAKSVAYVGHEKCLAGGDIVVMKHKQNPRYLVHVLATQGAREQKSKGKVKSKVVPSVRLYRNADLFGQRAKGAHLAVFHNRADLWRPTAHLHHCGCDQRPQCPAVPRGLCQNDGR